MKKTFKIIPASIVLVGALVTGCSTPLEKIEKAKDNVTEATQQLDEETIAYQKEMEDYRTTTLEQIAANEKSIIEFNTRIAKQKSEAKADYEKQIAVLNTKNSDLKKKIMDFKTESKASWETFRVEFDRDMTELGTSIKNFSITNEK